MVAHISLSFQNEMCYCFCIPTVVMYENSSLLKGILQQKYRIFSYLELTDSTSSTTLCKIYLTLLTGTFKCGHSYDSWVFGLLRNDRILASCGFVMRFNLSWQLREFSGTFVPFYYIQYRRSQPRASLTFKWYGWFKGTAMDFTQFKIPGLIKDGSPNITNRNCW